MGGGSSCENPGSAASSSCTPQYGGCIGNKIRITCNEPDTTFGCGHQYIKSEINIPNGMIGDSHTITDVNVWMKLAHTFVGDVEAGLFKNGVSEGKRLFHPGTGCDANDMDVTFDDSIGSEITACDSSSSPAYRGTHTSTGKSLQDFNHQPANGKWTLEVYDAVENDDGTFYEWGIELTIPSYCTDAPTPAPTDHPTRNPSKFPTTSPTKYPTDNPSVTPTKNPSNDPSLSPSADPSVTPTETPSVTPTKNPSVTPTKNPSSSPSVSPSLNPSISPSTFPSYSPSHNPTDRPSLAPTVENAGGIGGEGTTDAPQLTVSGAVGHDSGYANGSTNNLLDDQMTIIMGLSGVLLLTFCCLIIACVCIFRKRRANKKRSGANSTESFELHKVTSVSAVVGTGSSAVVGEGANESDDGWGGTGTRSNGHSEVSSPIDTTPKTGQITPQNGGTPVQSHSPLNSMPNMTGMNYMNVGMNGGMNNMAMLNPVQLSMMNQMNAQMNMMSQMNMMQQPLPSDMNLLSASNSMDAYEEKGNLYNQGNTAGNIEPNVVPYDEEEHYEQDPLDDSDEDGDDANFYGRNNVSKTQQ